MWIQSLIFGMIMVMMMMIAGGGGGNMRWFVWFGNADDDTSSCLSFSQQRYMLYEL